MGQGKDHMKIRGINDFRPAIIHPDFLADSLAVWAVPVAAGIIMGFCMPAFGTDADITAALLRFTADDGPRGFQLNL